jgi:hypothetical protein
MGSLQPAAASRRVAIRTDKFSWFTRDGVLGNRNMENLPAVGLVGKKGSQSLAAASAVAPRIVANRGS